MYNAPAAQTGSGQQLAIITEGDVSQPKKDLATFEAKFGLPTVTWNQINVGTADHRHLRHRRVGPRQPVLDRVRPRRQPAQRVRRSVAV